MSSVAVTSATFGFTPRLYPRPTYPPFTDVLHNFFMTAILQAGIVGTLLATISFPMYQTTLALMTDTFGLSDAAAFSLMSSAAHTAVFVLFNGFIAACGKYGWGKKYALPRARYMVPSQELLRRTFYSEISGQVIFSPLAAYVLYAAFVAAGMPPMGAPLPTTARLFGGFFAAYLVNEWGDYWMHRLFHTSFLYARVHKMHHEYVGTVSISAEHLSPLEGIFGPLPAALGAVFCGGHPIVFVVWTAIRLQQNYEVHSGYCLAGTFLDKIGISHGKWAAHHDFHHTANRGNFGSLTLDWLFGTMDMYVQAGMTEGYIRGKVSTPHVVPKI